MVFNGTGSIMARSLAFLTSKTTLNLSLDPLLGTVINGEFHLTIYVVTFYKLKT